MRGLKIGLGVVVAALLLATMARKAESSDKNVKIGDRVSNLTFKDIRYLPRSLDDFPKIRIFVLAFINSSCPVAQRYLPTLKELEKEYRGRGVQFLAVNEGSDDSIVAMAGQAVKHEMEFPFVKDFDGVCAELLGVNRTAEVVVLDAERRIRYRGRIDDQYRLGGTRAAPTRRDLALAIDSVLAGKDVSVAETPVDGCPITRSEPAVAKGEVTFAGDVAPILRKNCAACHHPGTTAPFSLITYEDARAQAEAISEVVSDGRMPPWYASEEYGHFVNHRGLSADEKLKLVQWVHSGMAMGDAAKLPRPAPPAQPEDRWLIGKPDMILSAPKHDIEAKGLIAYKYIVLPYVFLSDTWMQGIQISPDNPRAVHHCNMAYFSPTGKISDAKFITGTVPGGSPMILDNGVAFCIPRGSSLLLQIHYVTTGKPEKCQISVGFKYAAGAIEKQLRHEVCVDYKFAIPPGAPAHPVSAARVLTRDAIGVGLFVHMHVRGRDMTFKATYPDGKTETLLMVPNYSFDWQMPYVWDAGAVRFPKGTRVEALAHYDNSTFNPYNPDPTATVKDGQQTHEEMLNGYLFYIDANEHLNLDIDPKNGHPRKKQTAALSSRR
jgi:thiol-disulfide isomerase/thioredoxin